MSDMPDNKNANRDHKTQTKKSWNQRKRGIMKKGDEIRQKFSARVAILIEHQGVLYAYQSHDGFPEVLPGKLLECNKMTAEDFITVAELKRAGSDAPSTPGASPSRDVTLPQDQTKPGVPVVLQRSYFDYED
jgi:hypothetical protein